MHGRAHPAGRPRRRRPRRLRRRHASTPRSTSSAPPARRSRSPTSPRSAPTRSRSACSASSPPRRLATGLVERRPDRVPGLYAISVDAAGERSFTYWRDASAARTLFQPPAEVTPDRLAGFALIYLSGITLAILAPEARAALARVARRPPGRAAALVAFDSNYRPRLWPDRDTARREIAALWAATDIGLPSLDDEMALFGDRRRRRGAGPPGGGWASGAAR